MAHKYRFKTKKEFEDDYGSEWFDELEYSWEEDMDYLFGRTIPNESIEEYEEDLEFEMKIANGSYHTISGDMIIMDISNISLGQESLNTSLLEDDEYYPKLNSDN
jgi:hypothetical protein